jgi:FtsP/CotA-like multicopper oxidase with cupredoxin domain
VGIKVTTPPHDIRKAIIPFIRMRFALAFLCVFLLQSHWVIAAEKSAAQSCPRPSVGSTVGEPADLHSQNGVLELSLTVRNSTSEDGSTRYCYIDSNGNESPNLRAKPGDLVIIKLKNDLANSGLASQTPATPSMHHLHEHAHAAKTQDPCASGMMSSTSTNLHFHGLTIPPKCHEDDVLKTSIQPEDPPFEYRFRIPPDEPPGLYWYHPHIHGFSKQQVLGGASGALIVEGTERADTAVAGLPERVLVIRDQDLLNPNAPPSKSEPVTPKFMVDRDGDATNTGTGFGKPAKDLSINFVPVPYPDYQPAVIEMKPGERQLWRVLNASAITYLNLEILLERNPQPLGLVAMDGVPLNHSGGPSDFVDWQTHLGVPPGARVEFIVNAPALGTSELLVTRSVDTGPGGENDPNRALAIISPSQNAPEPRVQLATAPQPLPPSNDQWLGAVSPIRVRKLYFSEKLDDPNNPASATDFYITLDGEKPQPFDPASGVPNIVVKQGTVEDWIIENRSSELHAFHIHQLHFMLLDYSGKPVNEPFLRDTVNVPYYNGRALTYPSVRLRMDFRDPNTVGTFVYHCHLLEHEDKGMMGVIQVLPADSPHTQSAGTELKHGLSHPN